MEARPAAHKNIAGDSGIRPCDCAQSTGENFRIVEFVRTALGYETGGYGELKKILKFDVAGAIEKDRAWSNRRRTLPRGRARAAWPARGHGAD